MAANGRALATGATDGMVKVVAEAASDKLLGVQIVARGASELIASAVAHMEYGGSSEDLARTIHAHPTLSESLKEAALSADGRGFIVFKGLRSSMGMGFLFSPLSSSQASEIFNSYFLSSSKRITFPFKIKVPDLLLAETDFISSHFKAEITVLVGPICPFEKKFPMVYFQVSEFCPVNRPFHC